jgi:transcriptional regulator with XRE-family HTH domain
MCDKLTPEQKKLIRQKFGMLMRNKRYALNISQEELSFRSGLHRTYIGSVERGERNIALENILLLAKALECSPKDLIPEVSLDSDEDGQR